MTMRCFILCCLALAGSADLTLNAQTDFLLEAEQALEAQEYTQALEMYTKLLDGELSPSAQHQVELGLAEAHYNLDNYPESIARARGAIALAIEQNDAINTARSQIVLAKILDHIGQMGEAESLLQESLNNLQQIETTPSYDQLEALRRLADLKSTIGQYELAEDLFQEALDLYEDLDEKQALELAEIHNRLGVHHSILRQFDKAKEHLDKAMIIRKELLPAEDVGIGKLYLSLGVISRNIGNFDQAKVELEKSLDIFNAVSPTPVAAGNSYYFLAGIYYYQGDFQSAERYFLASADIYFAAMGGENAPQLPSIYMALSAIDFTWGKYDEARNYINRTLNFFRNFNNGQDPTLLQALMTASQIEIAAGQKEEGLALIQEAEALLLTKEEGIMANILSYTSLGEAYCKLGDIPRGIEILEEGIALYINEGLGGEYLVSNVYHDLCDCYYEQKDYSAALTALRQGNEITAREFGNRHLVLAANYGRFANIFRDMGQIDSALHYAHLSLRAGHQYFDDPNPIVAPDLSGVLSPSAYVSQLRRKAEILADPGSSVYNSEAAHTHFTLATELASRLSNVYTSQGARLYFQEQLNPVFNGSLANIGQLTGIDEETRQELAHYVMEAGRAGLLTSVLQGVADQPFAGVPDDVRHQAASFRARLTYMEGQINEAKIDTSTAAQENLQPLLETQVRVQLAYDSLLSVLAADYPEFYNLNYHQQLVELEDLQSSLPKNSVLLEYFQTDEQLYTLVVSQDEIQLHNSSWSRAHTEAVEHLRMPPQNAEWLENPAEATRAYLEQSKLLYELLIAPFPEIIQAKQLIIIPHGSLNYLSFASLSSSVGDRWSDADFLLDHLSINYDYSSTLWTTNQSEKRRLHNINLLALAPGAEVDVDQIAGIHDLNFRDELGALSHSRSEVEAAAEFFPGHLLLGEAATEFAFKEQAPQAGILHLAMHALVSDSLPMYSRFLFSPSSDSLQDDFLHAFELYQLQLPAEMAVLSACNTGFGRFRAGEGVLSLAHAFRYAGTRSVIMSLWPAEDESTAKIISGFYAHLADGQSKDVALRMACQDYLDQADPFHAHPYFWSHLVPVGDMRPLKVNKFPLWGWLAAGLLAAIVLGSARRRRNVA